MKIVINEFVEVSKLYIELMNKTEKVKRNFNGIDLYPSEIHTLVFIQDNKEFNMTTIAQKLGVTKGAIFKIILKLEEKELLKRYKKIENNKNTYFNLTEKGILAYEGHNDFHKYFFENPSEPLKDFVSEHEELILDMFKLAKEYLQKHIEKIEIEK
ncbi:MarR family transcriptional regulator [Helicovermis profundi]|uniref:MarR family transcriptional regulator n=1 Tax=Helicovermis profundi TaxID=3065157 RepID=A0AAU9EC53_9FIRM|nr:MarR family transcriptional regulator [Clostridia bacterium S502]